MTAPTQVPVTRDDLGYEPKHRAQPTRLLSPLVDQWTLAHHAAEFACPACEPGRYAARAAKHRARVAS